MVTGVKVRTGNLLFMIQDCRGVTDRDEYFTNSKGRRKQVQKKAQKVQKKMKYVESMLHGEKIPRRTKESARNIAESGRGVWAWR